MVGAGGVSVSSPEPQRVVSPPPLSPPPLSPPLSPPMAACNPSVGLQGGVGLDGGLASILKKRLVLLLVTAGGGWGLKQVLPEHVDVPMAVNRT